MTGTDTRPLRAWYADAGDGGGLIFAAATRGQARQMAALTYGCEFIEVGAVIRVPAHDGRAAIYQPDGGELHLTPAEWIWAGRPFYWPCAGCGAEVYGTDEFTIDEHEEVYCMGCRS